VIGESVMTFLCSCFPYSSSRFCVGFVPVLG
jgi:hypothetical protein